VFRLDNRGTPRRGKAFETALADIWAPWRSRDQVAGARYLAGLPYVDGKRPGSTAGPTAGTWRTLPAARARAVQGRGGGAPVADWDGYDTHYTERYMAGRRTIRRVIAGAPPPSRITPLGRLLIVHGMIDENVHFRHTAG